jgi:hypothetical protein
LKPVFHLIGSRVETTWVPGAFQLWVGGSQRAPPRRGCLVRGERRRPADLEMALEVLRPPHPEHVTHLLFTRGSLGSLGGGLGISGGGLGSLGGGFGGLGGCLGGLGGFLGR